MKKITTISGLMLLMAVLAVPTFLWAYGQGWGGGMMGNWGGGAGYGCPYDRDDASLTGEQREKLAALDQKLFEETRETKNQLLSRSADLRTLLKASQPDPSAVKAVRKEISDLRGVLDEKYLARDIEAGMIVPEGGATAYGSGQMGYRGGYGQQMSGRGFGPGGCIN